MTLNLRTPIETKSVQSLVAHEIGKTNPLRLLIDYIYTPCIFNELFSKIIMIERKFTNLNDFKTKDLLTLVKPCFYKFPREVERFVSSKLVI